MSCSCDQIDFVTDVVLNDFIQICDGRREIDIKNRKKDVDDDDDDQLITVSFMMHYIYILYNVIF